jgi:hypothetical protein
MNRWQYFCVTSGKSINDGEPRGLGRTDRDGPPYNAQTIGRGTVWVESEWVQRYHLRGTSDHDYVEISEDRAIEIIEEWVASGLLPHRPDEPAGRHDGT